MSMGTLPPQFLHDHPKYSVWKKTDQLVLSILFSSISESVQRHILSSTTSHELWSSLDSLFTSNSQAKQFQGHFQLANLAQCEVSITDFFSEVRALADILASTGSPLPDQDFVTYLLTGLGPSYESFVTSITTRSNPVSSHELFQLLLVHESRLAHSNRTKSPNDPSVNVTTAAGRDQRGRGYSRGGRSCRNGNTNVTKGRSNSYNRGSHQQPFF